MSQMNYKVTTRRTANAVAANPQRIGEPSEAPGSRWATGRNVKVPDPRSYKGGVLQPRTYSVTDVWTLKVRADDGTVQTLATGRSRESAQQFVDSAKPKSKCVRCAEWTEQDGRAGGICGSCRAEIHGGGERRLVALAASAKHEEPEPVKCVGEEAKRGPHGFTIHVTMLPTGSVSLLVVNPDGRPTTTTTSCMDEAMAKARAWIDESLWNHKRNGFY